MGISNRFSVFLSLIAAGWCVSCDAKSASVDADDGDTSDVTSESMDASEAYFDYDNHYAVDDEARPIYAHFDSSTGKGLTVALRQQPEAANASVGFKLYEVPDDGSLRLLKVVDGHPGEAVATLESRGTGSYVI